MNELKQVVLAFSATSAFVAQDTPGPYSQEELGLMWLEWAAELSANSIRNYELVLFAPRKTEVPTAPLAAWGNVRRFDENHGVASWPVGPNRVFQQVLWMQYHKKLQGPFLWVEPDCIPVAPDWIDLIADEYQRLGKPFMGAIVEQDLAKGQRARRHMTGNAVYPDQAHLLAPKLMTAYGTAWDVLAAQEILPQAHLTKLIQHDWRRPEIQNVAELRRALLPDTVLFHSDKYGAIIRIMRQQGGNLAGTARQPVPEPLPARSEIPEEMPILEYAAQRGALAPSPSLDDALRICQEAAAEDPLIRKRIAKFMVLNDIVNHGHCTQYGKPFGGKKGAKYKTPAARGEVMMTDAEFQKRLAAAKENAPVTVTE
jgi:hypothetical protein